MIQQSVPQYWIFDNLNTCWPILSFEIRFLELLEVAPVYLKAEPGHIQHIQSNILQHFFANLRCVTFGQQGRGEFTKRTAKPSTITELINVVKRFASEISDEVLENVALDVLDRARLCLQVNRSHFQQLKKTDYQNSTTKEQFGASLPFIFVIGDFSIGGTKNTLILEHTVHTDHYITQATSLPIAKTPNHTNTKSPKHPLSKSANKPIQIH